MNMKKFSLDSKTIKGAAWILLYVFLSVVNEVVSFTGVKNGLHPAQMIFCRFACSMITTLPFMFTLHWFYDTEKSPALGIRQGLKSMRDDAQWWKGLGLSLLFGCIMCFSRAYILQYYSKNIIFSILFFIVCFLPLVIPVKIMEYYNPEKYTPEMFRNFRTKNLWHHAVRAAVLGLGILAYICSYLPTAGSVSKLSMSMNVMIGSALNPIATTLLAVLFFSDSINGYKRFILLNLAGVGLVLYGHINFNMMYPLMLLLLSVLMYGLTDIINKYSVNQNEPLPKIMFYTSLFIVVYLSPIAYMYWKVLSAKQICIFVIAGLNGNLVTYCLIKSLTYTDLSSMQLLKHLKLPWAFVCDKAVFNAVVGWQFWIGFLMVFIGSAWSTIKRIMNSKSL